MRIRFKKFFCCGAVLTLFVGCGGGEPNITVDPEALPFVQCSFQIGGEPIEGAIVKLHAADGQAVDAMSNFDSDNDCYRFVTTVAGAKRGGVPAGNYRITVKPGPRCNHKIPAKYAVPSTSGLEAEIKPGDNLLPAFELTI